MKVWGCTEAIIRTVPYRYTIKEYPEFHKVIFYDPELKVYEREIFKSAYVSNALSI